MNRTSEPNDIQLLGQSKVYRVDLGDEICCLVVIGSLPDTVRPSRIAQRQLCLTLLGSALRSLGVTDPDTIGVRYRADGSPALSSSGIGSISFAHDGHWCVVALAPLNGCVGIDIQLPRRVSLTMLQRLAPDLVARAGEDATYVEFVRRWTVREAVSKALGTGLDSELLRKPLPVARAGSDCGMRYVSLDRWLPPLLSLAYTTEGKLCSDLG